MPRKPRNSFETSFFHVIVQGLNKEKIFENDNYKKKYYNLVIENNKEFDIKILSYCIMNSHAHFLIYTENINSMSKFMKKINSVYGNYYNFMEDRVGYVFRDRYLSEPIYNYNYLYNCIAYIHANPIEAGIVSKYSDYRYSSYNDYINNKVNKDVLQIVLRTNQYFMDQFNYIHSKKYEFKECSEIKKTWKQVVDEYEKNNNIKISNIRNNKKILKDFIIKANKETGLSARKIAMKINLSKTYLYNIMNQK